MTCCKIHLIISALITCLVNANYAYEHLKSLSYLIDVPQISSKHDIYESASSETLPHYHFYESNQNRYRDHFESPSEHFPTSIKKKLFEKKNLKKAKRPFLTSNKDYTAKYKELLPDSEIVHCQEIKVKSIGKEDEIPKDVTTCYKCEDPKTKSVYKRCLYNIPLKEGTSDNTKMERSSSTPVNLRYRRSNEENDKFGYKKRRNPYRFTDEYFTDATYNVPAAYESKGERCDKIVKNSMICMVCQDAKTNGKYEQCSYVKQPREEAYAYTKSGVFEKPQEQRNSDSAEHLGDESNPYSESSDLEKSNLEKKDWNPIDTKESREYSYSNEPREVHTRRGLITNQQDKVQDASSVTCKQVQKDSKTCTVCKDPKIGGVYEKCTYNYQPSDKLYKYSRSKSFGYPDKISTDSTDSRDLNKTQASEKSKRFDYPQSSDSTHNLDRSKLSTYPWESERIVESQQDASDFDSTLRDSPNYNSDYSNSKGSSDYQPSATDKDDTESYEDHQTTPSSKSISERYSENIDKDHCKKIQKDSMTCTICKDPKTGNDFEQCSYSYQPNDKIFSYSKSSSFGNSQESDKYQQKPYENEESPDSSSPEIAKDSYNVPGESYEASTTDEAKDDSRETVEEKKEEADVGYLDTTKKKAEIDEFMQNFRQKDRSKCRKTMRDKMTCYQCVDEKGVQKEECAFVTGREPDQLAFREIKEFQIDPASHPRGLKQQPSSTKTSARAADPLEPNASASKNSYVKLEKPDNDYPDETQHVAEETKEAEPYDYTSETRSRYDKVLGLTLPAYMFATSEHEAAFDEVVASSHDQH